jgi:endonuclease III
MSDVWNIMELLTCDTHVAVGALAWGWADQTTKKISPDNIAKQIEDWLDNCLYRDVNSTFAGLRQLWQLRGDECRRERAKSLIESLAKKKGCWKQIRLLVTSSASQFNVVQE